MGFFTSVSKQALKVLICFCLVYTPFFARAASLDGWTLGGGVAQGASVVYNGAKEVLLNGKKYLKQGTAIIKPNAAQVAKQLGKGVAGVALSVAVEQLLGAVDWVLDPANNQIKYYPPNSDPADPNYQWLWNGTLYNSAASACRAYWQNFGNGWSFASVDRPDRPYPGCVGYNAELNRYDASQPVQRVERTEPVEEQKPKILPLEVVAQKVIDNAAANDPDAQVATVAAAGAEVAEAENDASKRRPIVNQLEQTSSTPTDQTGTGTATKPTTADPENPTAPPDTTDLSFEFPVFCGWAPTVCEAAQTVISFPNTLTEWWETGTDKVQSWADAVSEAWTKVKDEYADKPKENTDTELDIPDSQISDVDTNISFGGQCPVTRSIPVSFAGISTTIDLSFEWLCEVASIAKPVVIAVSAFSAVLIVAGIRTEDD